MGKRGPQPLSAAELAKRGSWRAKKRAKEEASAPQPPQVPDGLGRGVPSIPRHLSKQAREIWNRVVPDIDAMGLLTTADGGQLAEYCTTLATVYRLQKHLEKHGFSYEVHAPSGTLLSYRKRPEVSQLREAQGRVDRLAQQFGLTPVARSRVEVTAAYTSTVKRAPTPAAPVPSATTPSDPAKPPAVIDGSDRFFRGG